MKRQVIETFLNLSGVLGIALMDDGHSRPYFHGIDTLLNGQQREALTQGVQQVVSTTPSDFTSFTFYFLSHNAHIYKLTNGTILLVLTAPHLDIETYTPRLTELQQVLQDDAQNAIANFRLLAGSSTLTTPNYWQPTTPAIAPYPTPSSDSADSTPDSTPPDSPTDLASEISWEMMLTALNSLSDATAHYLGKIVVANTWRSSRPAEDCLDRINLDRNGHFALGETSTHPLNEVTVDAQTLAALRLWASAFSIRCARIIRDYREMVLLQGLNEQQQAALQIPKTD
ncbi:MAG: hypothetical protein HC812_10235 [Leptolyngbya sp. RL_3_1]|nr:hypothetical protein [Leptolyngbya sp. RL_3_1]